MSSLFSFFFLLGKVYNDIGLLYNGLKSYKNAAECFELAIPLMRTENPDKSLEAVLQQNLGAVYNQLKEYNKAMDCHRQAVSLHGEKRVIIYFFNKLVLEIELILTLTIGRK